MNKSGNVIEEVPMTRVSDVINNVIDQLDAIILGKRATLELALSCLLARGHLLIEDVPGVGKTTLAHALAKILGLSYQRIQFTSDLLPADIVGISVFERDASQFVFHRGPLFNQVVVADEINRATPKTQSALLEAMEETQVTADGNTYDLPDPFFVIATQNPAEQIGTFPLPESQLDRFLMRLNIGFPSPAIERELLLGEDRQRLIKQAKPALSAARLAELQQCAANVHVSDALLDYLQRIVTFTRDEPDFVRGLSPRAALGLMRCAKAWALVRGADAVVPEDLQAIAGAVIDHRVMWRDTVEHHAGGPAAHVIGAVAVN